MTSRSARRPVPAAVTALLAAALVGGALAAPAAEAADPAPTAVVPFDLDGDGRADVVAGLPLWNGYGSAKDTGAVVIISEGRNELPWRTIHLATPGIPGHGNAGARFGAAVASGDFDGDGYADLAVGAPGHTVVGSAGSGSVTILYGGTGRIGSRVGQVRNGGHRLFGSSLVAADLDADGATDLAVGAPGDEPQTGPDRGSGGVVVLHGDPAGLSLSRSTTVTRPSESVASFGAHLAAGDVDGDGDQDLVEGAAGALDPAASPYVRGHVSVAFGSPAGIGPAAVIGLERPAALAVGDLTGDGYADIVVGEPYRSPYPTRGPVPRGRVTLYRGSPTGPMADGQRIRQGADGVPGDDERGDRFGADVALSDVDEDGVLDLLVGAPGEDRGRGRVTLLRGVAGGIDRRNAVTMTQASPGIPGRPEAGDRFGAQVATVDVTGDGRKDLLVGAPGENDARGSLTVVRLRGIFYVPGGVQSYTLEALREHRGGRHKAFGSVIGR